MKRPRGFGLLPLLLPPALGAACEKSPTGESPIRERWYQSQPGHAWARPAIAGGLVYFGTGDGQVIARDQSTGVSRWATRLGTESVDGANLLVRGGVLVAPSVRETVGLDGVTGRELWRYQAPLDTTGKSGGPALPGQSVLSHIDSDGQSVFIPTWGAFVSAVDLRTGQVRWTWSRAKSASDTAASGVFRSGSMGVRVSGDTVYATLWHFLDRLGVTSESGIVAIDRGSGRELWHVTMREGRAGVLVRGAPSVYRNLVLFADGWGHAYAVDRFTTGIVWQRLPQGHLSTTAQLELMGDSVYLDGGDEHLYALAAADGAVRWKAPFPSSSTTDLLVTGGRIYVATGMYFHGFDRATGRKVMTAKQPRTLDGLFASAATAAEGQIFVTVNGAAWSFDEP